MAKFGTSNPDRTISLKAAVRSCTNKQTHQQQYSLLGFLHLVLLVKFQFCSCAVLLVLSCPYVVVVGLVVCSVVVILCVLLY